MSDIRKAHQEEQDEARRQKQMEGVLEVYERAMRKADQDYRESVRRINRNARMAMWALVLLVGGYVLLSIFFMAGGGK